MSIKIDNDAEVLAKILVLNCVRNSKNLEDLHAGIFPETQTGDYSDVKVIDGYGNEIPWTKLSRFNDDEMKGLIKDIVNKVYTYLMNQDNPSLTAFFRYASANLAWDEPELDKAFATIMDLDKGTIQNTPK